MRALKVVVAATIFATAGPAALARAGPVRLPPPRPLPGTARLEVGAADPAGGPRWAVRSYRARGDQLCVQVGRLRGGRLLRVFAGGRSRALRLGELASCATTHAGNVPTGGPLVIERFVDDPRRAHPRIVRTVVAGAGGATMGRVTLRARGVRTRSFRLSGRGAFLAVLPGRVGSSDVVLTYRRRSALGQILIIDNRGRPGPGRPVPGSARVERTRADPAGGRPFGLLVWRSGAGGTCSVVGRLVAGEVGDYDPVLGTFDEYPLAAGGSCPPLSFASGPLVVAAGVGESGVVVNGFARGDVTAVTVADERGDPHVLGLSARSHAFLDVRRVPDGPLRVTATLRDGTSVTQEVTVGVPGVIAGDTSRRPPARGRRPGSARRW